MQERILFVYFYCSFHVEGKLIKPGFLLLLEDDTFDGAYIFAQFDFGKSKCKIWRDGSDGALRVFIASISIFDGIQKAWLFLFQLLDELFHDDNEFV